jgi:uncharacterized protein DUF998
MSTTHTTATAEVSATREGPTSRVTRSLLGCGVIAGPLYLVVALAQALTRDGFDIGRHAASLLSNGELGWIQITNFLVTGAMVVAGAIGIRRAGHLGTRGPRLLAAYGVCGLIGAGVFVADPAFGFPAGTPEGQGAISWHGLAHLAIGGIGFLALIAACFVIARRFTAQGEPGWAWSSRITGVVFLAGFAGLASGSGSSNPTVVLGFWVAASIAFGWLSALSVHVYRSV